MRAEQFPMKITPIHRHSLLALICLAAMASRSQGAEFTVSSTADSGSGTLRAALASAAANSEADTIRFAPALTGQVISLTTNSSFANLLTRFGPTGLVIDGHAVTLDGSDAPFLAISGANSRRLFAVTTTGALTLKNITLTGGFAKGGNGGNGYQSGHGGGGGAGLGGAVWVEGTLAVTGCTFHGNSAQGGNGGAPGPGGGNTGVGGGGGGLGVDGANGSDGGAGAVPGTDGNAGTTGSFGGGGGGGVFTEGACRGGFGGGAGGFYGYTVLPGQLGGYAVGEVSKGGGAGAGLGGAIFIRDGVCSLINSTFTNNTANPGSLHSSVTGTNTATGSAGAVFNHQGDLSILNCTLHANTISNASLPGPRSSHLHVFVETTGKGLVSMYNTILGGSESNQAYVLQSIYGVTPNPVQGTNNVIQGLSASAEWTVSGRFGYVGSYQNLGSLADNGGPTLTLLPAAGGSAVNQGSAAAAAGLTVDQRGKPRFAGSKLDIGAVQITLGPPMLTASAAQVTGLSASLAANISLAGASAVSERGFVWANASTNANPEIGGIGVTRIIDSGNSIGEFTTQLSSLSANTAYVFKAYATNSVGTAYTAAIPFTTNQAPVITSNGGAGTAAVTVVENSTAVATVHATDADVPAQQISYAIVGGADAAKFEIQSSTGVLSFVEAPDFDIAGDANADRVYEVIVEAADNGNTPRTDSQHISVSLSDLAEAPLVNSPTGVEITPVRATLGGTVVNDGGGGDAGTILERGVVYSPTDVNSDPRLGGNGVSKTISSGTTGVYALAAIELSPGTSYTYRPYAINAQGTSYGATATLVTAAGPALTGDVWSHYAGSTTGASGATNGTGTAARFNGPKGIVVDGNGDPFVADTLSHTIRKIVGGTAAVSTEMGSAGISGTSDSGFFVAPKFNAPDAMTAFGAGGTTIKYYIADTANHTVRLATWTFFGGWNASTHAGTAGSPGFMDATGTAARFRNPGGISTDGTGNVYVADTGNHAIRRIDSNKVVTTPVSANSRILSWGGFSAAWGTPAAGGRPLVENALSADISETHMIVALADGTVDTWGGVVEAQEVPVGLTGVTRVAAGKNLSIALKANGTVSAWGRNTSGQATVPESLTGVTAIDAGDENVIALKSDGSVVVWGDTTFALNAVPSSATGVASVAMGAYHALALKSDRTVVAWGNNYYGQTSVPAGLGEVSAIAAGTTHSLALKTDGTVVAWGENNRGQCNVPSGLTNVVSIAAGREFSLALKSDGNIVGWGSNAKGTLSIPADVLASGPTSLVAGSFQALAIAAPLKSPGGVAADAQGNLFIADTGNHVIRKYTASTGVVSVFAGFVGQSGNLDGLGTFARLNSPKGVAVDADGNVYVTDDADHTVRWITRDGIVRTLGGLAGTSGLANGAPEVARFKNPAGVASGGTTLYVADTGNNRIVKGTPLFRPIIGAAGATDVTLTSVTLRGWVNPNGKASSASFQYGLTSSYGTTVPVSLASNASTSAQVVSAELSGLVPGTTYHYRLTATNADGTTSTLDGSFSTGGAPALVSTPVSSAIGTTTATLGGEVSSDGNMPITERGIIYALSASNSNPQLDGAGVTRITETGSIGAFSKTISGLQAATQYSFRAYATNAAGTSYSAVSTFTTTEVVQLNPSETWRQQHFGTTGNSGNAADLAAPDGDGVPNLLKYALGLTPGQNGAGSLPKARIASNSGSRYLSLSFSRDPSRNDVTVVVEVQSSIAGTWTEIARSVNGAAFTGEGGVTETDAAAGTKDVEIRDTQTVGSSSRRFMRVRVQR